jgi:hypothetical protein
MAYNRPLTREEISLIYRCENNEENNEALAVLYEKTASAIDWVHRYIEDGGIGPRPSMRLTEIIDSIRLELGSGARGRIRKLWLT